MIPLLISVAIFLLYLARERRRLDRWIDSIPLRIGVTGTRGKSSVTRMLASVLREDGRTVLAKTTGSQARYILPGGNEIDVPRRGVTSIIEQKKFVRMAADMDADCIVAEIMSISPENHFVESHKLLRPNVVVLTNVRIDHIDAMGGTEEEIAWVYGLDIPENARVFIPELEKRHSFEVAARRAGAELIEVPAGASDSLPRAGLDMVKRAFPENLDLVWSIGRDLGIDEDVVATGIAGSRGDIGELRVWKYRPDGAEKECFLVNCFAANDPESTLQVITRLVDILPAASDRLVGLLSLRADKGDRTLQWIEAMEGGLLDRFSRMYVTGPHSAAVGRRLQRVHVLRSARPEKLMESIVRGIEDRAVILGLGNIRGVGELVVEYWQRIGEEYGL